MNGNVHKAIAQASRLLLSSEYRDFLDEKIDFAKWQKVCQELMIQDNGGISEDSTFWDLFVLGAVKEDECMWRSDVDAPDHTRCACGLVMESAIRKEYKGELYQHWLEHFWNTDMKDDHDSDLRKYGFEFTHDYIRSLVKELIGADYFLRDALLLNFVDDGFVEVLALIIEVSLMAIYRIDKVFDRYRSAPNRAQRYWKLVLEQYEKEKERAFFNLGKVCHLIADVGTPAHMHGDGHADNYTGGLAAHFIRLMTFKVLGLSDDNQSGLDDDEYEAYTGRIVKSLGGKLPKEWNVYSGDSFEFEEELYGFFSKLGRFCREFDSDDCDGVAGKNTKPQRWKHFEYYDTSTWRLERQSNDDLTEYACDAMAQCLIPETIRYTAGVLWLFAKEKSLSILRSNPMVEYEVTLKKIKVIDDTDSCGKGELYFYYKDGMSEGGDWNSLKKISANSGDLVDLSRRGGNTDSKTRSLYVKSLKNNPSFTFRTRGEDNDDYWFFGDHRSRDTLGYTKRDIDVSKLEKIGDKMDLHDVSSNGKYEVYYSVKYLREYESGKKENIYNKNILNKRKKNSYLRYKEGETLRMQPMNINLDTMHLHMHTQKSEPCKTGEKAAGRKLSICQYDEEMFKPRKFDAKESLNRIDKILQVGEKILQDSQYKKFFVSCSMNENKFKESIKRMKNDFGDEDFRKKFIAFGEDNATEYQYWTNRIMQNHPEKKSSKISKWACSNPREFYEAFSTKCPCCNDKKTSVDLEQRKQFIEKKYK